MAMLLQYNEDGAGIKIPIEKQQIHIGRDSSNEISIDDELVSKVHAVIEVVLTSEKDGRVEYYIQDLDSTNHTFVNDETIKLHKLRNDDIIRIGMNNFKFVDEAEGELDETAKLHKTWIPGVFFTKGKKKK